MVADLLAAAVGRDWFGEAQWRKLFDPYPLPVQWVQADPDLVVTWPALLKLAGARPGGPAGGEGWAAGPDGLAGAGSDLASVLRRVPTGRLVVLGDKGAGKTIWLVRLVLDLLARHQPGEPVPILLPLASWNPDEEDLARWIVRWLITDRAGLAAVARAGTRRVSLARALVDAGLILPVLDGLDEIPDTVRGAVIARINDAMRPDRGLVLAARTSDYRHAVHPATGSRVLLTGAAGIELQPLPASVVADYLTDSAGGPEAASRWDQVIAAFTAVRPPPVAQTLTTPLMTALARVAYNPRPGEDPGALPLHPAELLDPELFPRREAVEEYLFDRFIPASYRPHKDPSHPSRRDRWTAGQASRWLAFLARYLEEGQDGSTDLAWWQLPAAAARHLASVVVGLMVALIAGIGYPYAGFGAGLTAGIVAGLVVRWLTRSAKEGLARGLAGGITGGLAGALIALAVLGPGPGDYLIGKLLSGGLAVGAAMTLMRRFLPAMTAGLAGMIVVGFYENSPVFAGLRTAADPGSHLMNGFGAGLTALLFVELTSRDSPARGIRWSPAWLACGAASGLVIGLITWRQAGWLAGLAVGLGITVASAMAESVATDLASAASPGVVLRRDRVTFAASWLGVGVALGIASGLATALGRGPAGHPNGVRFGLQTGLTNVLAVGLIFGFIQALWGPFTVARWYLAASGRLPWRFMTFLHDAHAHHGVLRQVGAVYQFRHVELQRRLAKSPKPPDAAVESAATR